MKRLTRLICFIFFFAVSGEIWATPPSTTGKCDDADIANGPFSYQATGPMQATFNGTGGTSVDTSFSVQAPSSNPDTTATDVFPGQGATNACSPTALAEIAALEIQQVADALGNPLSPAVGIDTDSTLGQEIIGAFIISPTSHTFLPGGTLDVSVTVNNPNVNSDYYGTYVVKLAAKADGYGIGVGPGVTFTLVLGAQTVSDKTSPVVTVTKPTGDEILGLIGVEVQAYDPTDPNPGATGLASLTASVSSAGNTVSNLPITLTLDTPLTALPGVTVTGTGSFSPTGGPSDDTRGTTDALAFTSGARSGIGNYTITATAIDGAGNLGQGTKNFNINYLVGFTIASGQTTGVCASTASSGNPANCSGSFKFTVNRSSATSDGAFMFDHTVEVDIVRSDNTIMATHVYGTGAPSSNVQITTTPLYQTDFTRGNLYASVCIGTSTQIQACLRGKQATYSAKVYFRDVDNNRVLQATSSNVTF
jgi:hypothetical protein